MTSLTRVAAIIALSCVALACTSAASPTAPGATSTPTTAAPATPTEPAGPTEAPTDAPSGVASTPEPTAEPSPTTEPAPTLGGDVDLASLIPTEIGGQTMTLEPASDPGQSFLILWNDEQIAEDLLESLGKTPDDVDIVFAYASDAEFPEMISINAYRVIGADGEALFQGMTTNYLGLIPEWAATEETVGGKEVTVLGPATATPGAIPQYFYAYGDIVFNVNGNPPEWVEEAFTKLP